MQSRRHSSIERGFTLTEIVTALVVALVLAAVAVVMWRSHLLRERRGDAVQALLAVQTAEDQYFGLHARYADETQLAAAPPAGLGIKPKSRLGFYTITIRNSADNLGYWATARAIPDGDATRDSRCVEMRIDQNGRRVAIDAAGEDRSADCWK
jgi:type IV pilus assembly protein PilE